MEVDLRLWTLPCYCGNAVSASGIWMHIAGSLAVLEVGNILAFRVPALTCYRYSEYKLQGLGDYMILHMVRKDTI